MEKINDHKIIAVYARVSTSNQEEQQTIKTQLSAVNKFAEENNYKIAKEYIDNGWSGDILARPALDQLRQDAKENKWEAVLIYDPDRLARRYSYQELVMDELVERGKEVIYVTVKAPQNSEDKILYGVRGLFAEYERAKISERFRLGKLRKVNEGHILVSEALYGYTYVSKKDNVHGYYKINKDEAEIVRNIFNWVANEGLTIRKVVNKLHELGIKPRRSKRGVWNTSTLSTMLRHQGYIGKAHWGSSYAVVPENPTKNEKYKKIKKSSRKIRPVEDWIFIDIPPIIDENLFNKTRERIDNNNSICKRNKKNDYLLSSKIYCTCGRKRGGEGPEKGKHLYYRCSDRVCCYPLPRKCFEHAVNARKADALVWNKISELMSSPELMKNQIEKWINTQGQNSDSDTGTDINLIKKEIQKLSDKETRYCDAYASEVFSLNELEKHLEPIRKEKTDLEAKIEKHKLKETKVIKNIPTKEEIESFSKECIKTLRNLNFEAKRVIILNTIDKVVGTKHELQVEGYLPIKSNINVITINRNRWTT